MSLTPSSLALKRMARALARHARTGALPARARDLFLFAQRDPKQAAELLMVLADMAAAAALPEDPDEERGA